MTLTVHYWGELRDAAGLATEEVIVDDPCDLRNLAGRLAALHSPAFRDLLIDPRNQPWSWYVVNVNDQLVRWSDPRSLCDGDRVNIVPVVSGG
jgi:molybdopterin converting factor small subunit